MKLLLLTLLAVVGASEGYKRVCYYANWRIYRTNYAKFVPEDIDATLCTHVMYSFAFVSGNSVVPSDSWADIDLKGYSKVVALKQQNAELKVFLALGGASAAQKSAFRAMASSSSSRKTFVANAVQFLKTHGFDGLDYDWEYPDDSKANFAALVKETYAAFQAENLGLSAAVSAFSEKIDQAYDIPTIAANIDFINLMSYDFHGGWDGVTGHHSGLYAAQGESGRAAKFNLDFGANYWVDHGLPKEKLIVGVGSYGKTWSLSSGSTSLGAPGGYGLKSPLTAGEAFLAYFEICDALKSGTEVFDDTAKVPYAFYTYQGSKQWISYDNPKSIKAKTDYIKANGFGGGMVWTLNDDDFKGDKCGGGSKYPIISVLKENLPSSGGGGSSGTTTPAATTSGATSTSGTTTTTSQTAAATTTTPAATTTTQAATTTTQAATTTTQAATTTTAAATTTTTTAAPQTTTASGSSGGNLCAGQAAGFYADPNDCTKYWQCWNGGGVQRSCAPGTVWLNQWSTCGFGSC